MNPATIRVDDPTRIKLIGHSEILRGHVESIARAINVANAHPATQGVAKVNSIFTWMRLAQRIPVHIHLDAMPPSVRSAAPFTSCPARRTLSERHPVASS